MHDFIQSLSFQAQNSPALARTVAEVLRSVMRSFDDEVPTYRPSPRAAAAPRRKARRQAVRNQKS